MIRHHPSEETLLARAAGTLPFLHVRVLAVHLSACRQCRNTLREIQEIGGALIMDLSPAPLADDLLVQTLARLAEPPPPDPAPMPVTLDALATGRWWWLGPGIHAMPLVPRDHTGTRLDLVRAMPGTAFPDHGHTGAETTCILQGRYIDQSGEYGPHDIAESDPDMLHRPYAGEGDECICLLATTGRLRARNWLVRMLQPLVGV
jgi:putative transcriptional regulator